MSCVVRVVDTSVAASSSSSSRRGNILVVVEMSCWIIHGDDANATVFLFFCGFDTFLSLRVLSFCFYAPNGLVFLLL